MNSSLCLFHAFACDAFIRALRRTKLTTSRRNWGWLTRPAYRGCPGSLQPAVSRMSVASGIVHLVEERATYAAEDMVMEWLDAARAGAGNVSVTTEEGRVTYVPETEPLFTRPSEVVRFVDEVMRRVAVHARDHGVDFRGRAHKPVTVLSHPGWKRATYRDGRILLPTRERGGGWALRGLVVLHEVAHHLNTGVDGAIIDAHGRGFRDTLVLVLEIIGWTRIADMLREAYRQLGLDATQPRSDGMLARVGKLLRHAEGASTEAERDAFFSKAQELATLHSIELAVARAAEEHREEDQGPTFEAVRLGHRGQPSNVRFVELMVAISRANDLRCTIRSDNTSVTLYGFPDDIDVAKTLYVSLVLQMVADADAYIRSGAHRPVHGRTARAAFYAGWTSRIGQRLKEAQQAARRHARAVPEPASKDVGTREGSRALALVAKEVEVHDYFERMQREHGVRGTWRGSDGVRDLRSVVRGGHAADRARLGEAGVLEGPD